MSATAIMPFKGTTEDEERGLDRRGGRGLGQRQLKEGAVLGLLAEELADRRERPMESKHETFCIVPHQTTERWDHINSQSVCLLSRCSQLIGPTMNLPVLKKRQHEKSDIPLDTAVDRVTIKT